MENSRGISGKFTLLKISIPKKQKRKRASTKKFSDLIHQFDFFPTWNRNFFYHICIFVNKKLECSALDATR